MNIKIFNVTLRTVIVVSMVLLWHSDDLYAAKSDDEYQLGMDHFEAGNYAKAKEIWSNAAAQGVAEAQYQLGLMYENGTGVEVDLVEAHLWYSLAAMADIRRAERARDRIETSMSDDEILSAQMLMAEFESIYGPGSDEISDVDSDTIDAALFTAVPASTETQPVQTVRTASPGENTLLADDDGAASKLAAEKLAVEKIEAEKLAAEKLEAEKLAAEKLEAEKLAAEKLEAEKLAAEKLEAEKLAAEKLAAEKLAAEKLEAEKLEAEKLAAEKLAAEKLEAEKLEAEKLEAEKLEAEKLAAEKLAAEKLAAEKLEAEKLAAEKLEAEKLEAERLAAKESTESTLADDSGISVKVLETDSRADASRQKLLKSSGPGPQIVQIPKDPGTEQILRVPGELLPPTQTEQATTAEIDSDDAEAVDETDATTVTTKGNSGVSGLNVQTSVDDTATVVDTDAADPASSELESSDKDNLANAGDQKSDIAEQPGNPEAAAVEEQSTTSEPDVEEVVEESKSGEEAVVASEDSQADVAATETDEPVAEAESPDNSDTTKLKDAEASPATDAVSSPSPATESATPVETGQTEPAAVKFVDGETNPVAENPSTAGLADSASTESETNQVAIAAIDSENSETGDASNLQQLIEQPEVPLPTQAAVDTKPESDEVDNATGLSSDRKGVERIQRMLAELGYQIDGENGDMGPKTRQAIRAFRRDTDLSLSNAIDVEFLATLYARHAARKKSQN